MRAEARRDIEEAIARLEKLVQIQPTAEREALLGSAYKRLVMVEGRADAAAASSAAKRSRKRRAGASTPAGDRLAALRAMVRHYGNAEKLAREAQAENLFYPGKNNISAELRLAFLERRPAELAADRMQAVRESLARGARTKPDFWSVVGQIELRAAGGRRRAAAGRRSAGTDRRVRGAQVARAGAGDVGLGARRGPLHPRALPGRGERGREARGAGLARCAAGDGERMISPTSASGGPASRAGGLRPTRHLRGRHARRPPFDLSPDRSNHTGRELEFMLAGKKPMR